MKLVSTPTIRQDTYPVIVKEPGLLGRFLGRTRTEIRSGWREVTYVTGILMLNPITEQMHKGQQFAELYDPRSGYEARGIEITGVERQSRLAYFSAKEQRVLTAAEIETRRKVDMRVLDPEKGDCVRASIATYMGLGYEQVPDFVAEKTAEEFWEAVESFFNKNGFELRYGKGEHRSDPLYLVSGEGPRGHKHMVVYRGGKLYHDPHPSRAGLRHVTDLWYPQLLDPMHVRVEQPVQLTAYTGEQLAIMCEINLPSLLHI